MLAIFCGRLLTHWLITLLISLIERKYLLKRNVLYFLVALKDSAEVFAWLGLLFLAWVWLIDHRVKRSRPTTGILNRVTRALASCLLGAALWLIKTFLIKLLAASFQCKRFFDRIHDEIFQCHVIRKLSNPVGKKISPEVNIEKLGRMKPSKVSAWKTKKLINIIKGRELSTLTHSLGEAQQQDKGITDEQKAKNAAKAIFKNVAKSGSQFIEENELLGFMTKEHVERLFAFFPEAKETRKIRKSFFKRWMVMVSREQKSLIRALKDTKTAIKELDNLASAVLLVVVIILWLLLTGLLTTQVLIFILSQLLLLQFIFGNAAKDLFEAIVFVFVKHPFDVSDRCLVDGDKLEVEEMNIMTTVFLTEDGEKKSYPNSVLASKPIINSSRSENMNESVEFMVNFSASDESLEALTNKIREYIERKPKHWHRDHSVAFKEIAEADNSKVLKMALHVTHTLDFQEAKERTKRRSELLLELKKIFEELHLK
ncbi:mechanosensitive ion channel protein 10-like [Eucalyptus grandis]|uniref:mechanosensitive ion channel protein 10-like n=1 Tax=Eucalyptus grandis TaxID=71139 RepID=UPI00192E9027|nr:mechanosensitive ion channel protein 10-like [Eucalyptus grandis]